MYTSFHKNWIDIKLIVIPDSVGNDVGFDWNGCIRFKGFFEKIKLAMSFIESF